MTIKTKHRRFQRVDLARTSGSAESVFCLSSDFGWKSFQSFRIETKQIPTELLRNFVRT